jgi:hypothetical protein
MTQTTCIHKVSPPRHVHPLTTHINRAMARTVSCDDNTLSSPPPLHSRSHASGHSTTHDRTGPNPRRLDSLANPPSHTKMTSTMRRTRKTARTRGTERRMAEDNDDDVRVLAPSPIIRTCVGSLPTSHYLVKCAATSIDVHTDFTRLQGAWWSPMHHGYLGRERSISDERWGFMYLIHIYLSFPVTTSLFSTYSMFPIHAIAIRSPNNTKERGFISAAPETKPIYSTLWISMQMLGHSMKVYTDVTLI